MSDEDQITQEMQSMVDTEDSIRENEISMDDAADKLMNNMDIPGDNNDLLRDDAEADEQAFRNLADDVYKDQGLNEQQVQRYTQKAQELFQTKTILDQRFNEINWESLRQQNPGEWSALRSDFHSAYAQLQQEANGIGQVEQAVQQQQQQAQQKYMQGQSDRLLNIIPEWKDNATKSKELKQIRGFLKSDYGFSDSDLNSVLDARLVKLSRDALKYQQKTKQQSKPFKPNIKRKTRKRFKSDNEPGSTDYAVDQLMNLT